MTVPLLSTCFAACAATPPRTSLDDEPPRIVSAFFGLDHALPPQSSLLLECREAPGADGIPVTFSRRVVGPIDPLTFTVITRSGAQLHPACATTRPASSPFKNHTVLLIGELGREATDPPVKVVIGGPLALAGGVDAHGLSAPVIALSNGPEMVLALGFKAGSIPSDCPVPGTRTVVMVVWAGGVKPAPDKDAEAHRTGYTVVTATDSLAPFALGDLNDGNNYVHLCLDREVQPVRIRFAPGVLVDPNGDRNPETSVDVSLERP